MADSEGGGRLGDLGKRRSLEDLIKDMVEKDLGPQQEIGPAPWDQIVEPLNPEPAPEQTPAPEEQTESEPEPVQPVVQPVTPAEEPVAEEEQDEKPEVVPLVEPKTPKPTEEIREEAPETPADTYNEWMNYLQEQEALAQEEEQVSANNREPEPEEGYVQPGAGTQKVLGTYPAGTMDYLRENDLDLDWLNSEDGQYWLESRNQPQPEMLFPTDYGGTEIPNMPEYTPRWGLEDFLNLGVSPATAESYWDGYRRNSYVPSGKNAETVNNIVNNIANSLNNRDVPAWLNTDNIIANREYTPAPYNPTGLDEAAKSVLQEIPGRIGNAIVDSLNNGQDNINADSADQIIANRDTKSTPYSNPEFDEAVKSMLSEIPGMVGNAVVDSLNNGTTNVSSESADQIIANRDRNGTPYRNTELDNAVKDILSGLITGSLNDQEANAELANLMGVNDLLDNRNRDENNRFVNEEFNNSIRDILTSSNSWQDNLGWTEPRPNLGNDPMAQFADLFETPPADQSQGLNTSPEYLAYLRDNPRLGASSYDEFADRMGNQNAAVPVPRTEPNTAAEDDWRTLIDQWENAEAANNELFRESLEVPRSGDGQVRDTVAKGAQSVINRWNADEEADAWVAAHRNPDTPWDQIDAEEDALYEQYYEGLENGTIQREQPLVTSNDVRDWMDQADADVKDWLDQAGSDIEDFLTPSEEAQAKYDEYEQATETVRDAGLQEGTPEFYNAVEDLLESEPPAPTGFEAYAERVADREYNPGSRDSSAYYSSSRDNAIADVMNTGVNGSVAANIVDNPADYTYDETTGRWTRATPDRTPYNSREELLEQYPDEYYRDPVSGRIIKRNGMRSHDYIDPERLMDDLMLMNAPGLMNEAGDFNTAAQALFMDELTPEQKLHLFDRNGSFFNEGSGVNVDMGDLYADLVANDTMHARRNPELSDTITVTPDQYETMINEFLDKNPLIKAMVDLGQVTLDQVAENFFKNVQVGQKKGGGTKYGSGSYRGGYGGGGYRGGYGGGRSYGGYQQNPTAANQTTQRINNIMKNWSF